MRTLIDRLTSKIHAFKARHGDPPRRIYCDLQTYEELVRELVMIGANPGRESFPYEGVRVTLLENPRMPPPDEILLRDNGERRLENHRTFPHGIKVPSLDDAMKEVEKLSRSITLDTAREAYNNLNLKMKKEKIVQKQKFQIGDTVHFKTSEAILTVISVKKGSLTGTFFYRLDNNENPWEEESDIILAKVGKAKKEKPAPPVGIKGKIGMEIKANDNGNEIGIIIAMTENTCVIRCEDGTENTYEWNDIGARLHGPKKPTV